MGHRDVISNADLQKFSDFYVFKDLNDLNDQ